MERIGTVACLAAVIGLALMAYAGTKESSTGSVLVEVTPNVSVSLVAEPAIQKVQTGSIESVITFLVTSNVQDVSLYVEASGLYKGNDPTSAVVPPIPLDLTIPAVIDPMHATPHNGGGNGAPWVGDGAPIGQYETKLSETICFQSSQNNTFNQEVDVIVTWAQNDADKPTGVYGGKIRLTAMVNPE